MSSSNNTGAGGASAASAGASSKTDVRLMVDGSFLEDQFLKCKVCHERFDQGERAPKPLVCHHTFCLHCLIQIFDHAQPPAGNDQALDRAVKCPACRVGVVLSKKKIQDLPNDHRVVQMMDFLSQAGAKSRKLCSKHEGQALNFFCKKCQVPVCKDCTVIDHKESEGHVVINLSEAMNEYSEQFTEMEEQSKSMLEKMNARSGPLANALKHLDDKKNQVYGDIEETFTKYRLLLEERQKALKDIVCQFFDSQKNKINARMVNVSEHKALLQKLYDEFKASKNSNNLQKLFTIMQQMKNHNMEFAEAASAVDNDWFEYCKLKAQNEGSFLRDLNNLGEVHREHDQLLCYELPPYTSLLKKQKKNFSELR